MSCSISICLGESGSSSPTVHVEPEGDSEGKENRLKLEEDEDLRRVNRDESRSDCRTEDTNCDEDRRLDVDDVREDDEGRRW